MKPSFIWAERHEFPEPTTRRDPPATPTHYILENKQTVQGPPVIAPQQLPPHPGSATTTAPPIMAFRLIHDRFSLAPVTPLRDREKNSDRNDHD
jgi:hypothetical protein